MVGDQPADQADERTGDEAKRRRGTRGGRGRGGSGGGAGRSEAPAAEPARTTSGFDEPRIVGRRPGRPALGPAAEAPREAPPAPAATTRRSPRNAEVKTEESAEVAAPATPAPSRRSRTAAPADGDLGGRVLELANAVAEQNQQLAQLHDELRTLGEQVERSARRARLGVFVDVPNLLYGTDRPLDMGKLLAYLADGRDVVRATAYAPVSDNPMEPVQQQRFVAPFIPYEYRIVTKPLKRFADGSIKGNFDVEMAVDLLTMADRLDVIAIVSGDSDFARVVEEVQSKGVRVEVVAFAGSTSQEMRGLADRYIEVGAIAHLIRA